MPKPNKKKSMKRKSFTESGHQIKKTPDVQNDGVTVGGQKNTKSHHSQLNRLKQKDPEFFKFLQEEDNSLLLNFEDLEDLGDLSDDSDASEGELHELPTKLKEAPLPAKESDDESEDNDETVEDEDADEDPSPSPKKSSKRKKIAIDESMIKKWQAQLNTENSSLTALRDSFFAFHACLERVDAVNGSGDNKNEKSNKKKKRHHQTKVSFNKYEVVGAAAFNGVVSLCMQNAVLALSKILNFYPESSNKSKSGKPKLPTSSQRWSVVKDVLKVYLEDVINLGGTLMEPSVTRVFLRHMVLLQYYYACFPKICKKLLKFLIKLWSTSENESVRVLAFICISKMLKMDKNNLFEIAQKQCYLSYVANSKFTSPLTLPMINFMQRTYAEICALDPEMTYRFAFVYIRQLAVHLRKAITTNTKESRQVVYNWQYVHSISLWCRVIGILHPNAVLHPLIYPLVQISLGVINLVPTAKFYPLRFHIVNCLCALGDCTNVYIPLLPFITAPLQLAEFKKKPVGVAVRPMPFECILKLSNSQLKEKSYRDSTIDHVFDLLINFFNSQAHTIAFPEMNVPTIMALKKFVKECNNDSYSKVMRGLVGKVLENSTYISHERSKVTFKVSDVDAVDVWELRKKESGEVPFNKYYKEYKLKRRRELEQQIADKSRSVEENLPSIDRMKFDLMEKKAGDKTAFNDLLGDGGDDDAAGFTDDLDFEDALLAKKSKTPVPEDDGDDDDDESDDEAEEASTEKVTVPSKTVKKTTQPSKKLVTKHDDENPDIVENFTFSDDED